MLRLAQKRTWRLGPIARSKSIRAGGVLLFGVLLFLAALWLSSREEDEAGRGAAPAMPTNPLAAEFARCQELGEAGSRDTQCLRVWAENRRRFLGLYRRPLAVNPAAAQPAAPTER